MDMQSTIERISPVECRVKVEIPWSEISGRLDTKMRDLRRRARLPGFRPGKVPPQVIERMFGKNIREELAEDLVGETFESATAEHQTTPLTRPVLESSHLADGEAFVYAARFEVRPDIQPQDYFGVPVRRRPAVVDESKVEAELAKLREQLTEFHPLPEPPGRELTEANDVWTVDVEGTIGTQRISKKDVKVTIGDDAMEFIPGIGQALAALKLTDVGQTKTLEFTPPPERIAQALRGQAAHLTVGLREVRVKHIPVLDDDFARDTGEAETLDELKQKISDKIREDDASVAEREARRRLVEALLERNAFEPAPSMIGREVAAQLEQMKGQLRQQGMTLAALGTNERDLALRMRPQSVFNVKAFLLLDAIGNVENIVVSDEDFDAELSRIAEENGQNLVRMRASMEKNGQLLMIRAQMREERILDRLMEKADVTEAPDPEGEDEPSDLA